MNVFKPHLQTTIWTLLKAGASQREIERRAEGIRLTSALARELQAVAQHSGVALPL